MILGGSYIVTGSTLHKEHFFKSSVELDLLQSTLFEIANKYGWRLEAWAIFSNHYHFIAHSPADPSSLSKFIRHFHANSARLLNQIQNQPGRKVWYQYRDTQLTFAKSYFARLNYVMQNPVRHGLVYKAEHYPWCSAQWFENNSSVSHQKTVASFKIDGLSIEDDF